MASVFWTEAFFVEVDNFPPLYPIYSIYSLYFEYMLFIIGVLTVFFGFEAVLINC